MGSGASRQTLTLMVRSKQSLTVTQIYSSRCYWDTSNLGVLWQDGVKNSKASDILSRPYPVSVAGIDIKYSFDSKKNVFKLEFQPNRTSSQPSKVFLPQHIYGSNIEFNHSEDLIVSIDKPQYLEFTFKDNSTPQKSWLVVGTTKNIPNLRSQSWLQSFLSYVPFLK